MALWDQPQHGTAVVTAAPAQTRALCHAGEDRRSTAEASRRDFQEFVSFSLSVLPSATWSLSHVSQQNDLKMPKNGAVATSCCPAH